FVFFFFFQAEDGIRDRNVTGVQTCALTIFQGVVYGAALVLVMLFAPEGIYWRLRALRPARRAVEAPRVSAAAPRLDSTVAGRTPDRKSGGEGKRGDGGGRGVRQKRKRRAMQ